MNKYHAKRVEYDGIKFDSIKEKNRYVELKLMEKANAIQDLKLQQKFVLFPKNDYGNKVQYIADFTYIEDGKFVVEDVKSAITRKNQVYRLKKRILAEHTGHVIKET